MRSLHPNLRDSLGMLIFHCLRALERLLPPTLLRYAVYPVAAILALRDLSLGNYKNTPFSRLPSTWPTVNTTFCNLLRIRIRHHLSRCIAHWPDRLDQPRWSNRFRIDGDLNNENQNPVILVSSHFGGMHLGSFFFRALGLPVATFIGDIDRAKSATRRAKDRLSHLPNMRHFFSADDSVREVCRFLDEGNILRMTFDVPTGRRLLVPLDDTVVSFATGSIRLAAATGATVVPYVISESSPWCFVCRLGKPVPQELLHNCPEAAASHILEECSRFLRESPDEAEWTMLLAFSRQGAEPSLDP